jgi:hypothetical protein
VRTRVSERKGSADSNQIAIDLYPVPQRIENLQAAVTEKSIHLTWSAPTSTSAGAQLPPVQEYHVYRGELDASSTAAAEKGLRSVVWKFPLLRIGVAKEPGYEDASFDFDRNYAYVVRSVISEAGAPLESADSNPVILTAKDIFPPAAPQDLVAAVLPGPSPGSSVVDLSWSINLETDLAGYRVYRNASDDGQGQLLTPDLVRTPSYRDTTVASGHRFWYTVTAVDRSGNESPPSKVALAEVP